MLFTEINAAAILLQYGLLKQQISHN